VFICTADPAAVLGCLPIVRAACRGATIRLEHGWKRKEILLSDSKMIAMDSGYRGVKMYLKVS
jgi:hypothetical protein